MIRTLSFSGDLGSPAVVLACLLAALGVVLLGVELFWRTRRARATALRVAATGVLAALGLLAAVLRPVAIVSKGTLVGPKVVVLADASRSIDLPGDEGTRRQTLERALTELDKRTDERLSLYSFGSGPAIPISEAGARAPGAGLLPGPDGKPAFRAKPVLGSALGAALPPLPPAPDARPAASGAPPPAGRDRRG